MQNIIRILFNIECYLIQITMKIFNILLVAKQTFIDICERALREFYIYIFIEAINYEYCS